MAAITQGVKDFLKSSHKPDSTEVCSEVAPEVTQEHIRPQEHTETVEAIDRERHVHHHQHRVQPIEDHKVLETKHVQSTAPAVVREHKEDMLPEHQQKLHEQRSAHTDTTRVGEVERSAAHLGTHVNQHEHHHIHETVQPVIQRETVQPTTVHHTVAVQEKIHDAPIVHEATVLPTISHADFLKQKQASGPMAHADEGHKHSFFSGAPKIGSKEAGESSTH
ncbi:uncharacterized protein MKK02DRAFT_42583 [Dioszegia hungarica]|uniref:Allergen n=1 Tax=Dioszegia hungarica TaxID=4972 RepID=A0AA38HDM7_9TREE|nr:uncharacterized protein MKK02DRAFT_42583 [Dioszegia hungarica]KAI9638195.1 hypothetical protein MKK02DRAFT_42583 [Dioszegia hungarica]